MRKFGFLLFALVCACVLGVSAQEVKKPEGYKFTDIKRLPTMSVKDQAAAGTCWSWSGISFFESEMLRMGKDSVNLSAMYVVRHAYSDKATKYVRMHGNGRGKNLACKTTKKRKQGRRIKCRYCSAFTRNRAECDDQQIHSLVDFQFHLREVFGRTRHHQRV